MDKTVHNKANLEHVNITVSDPARTAETLCQIFDWKIRWHGPAKDDGITYHVGDQDSYIAIYSKGNTGAAKKDNYETRGGLNHIGILVEDLDAIEEKVIAAGFHSHLHADYEPGRRFYFNDADEIEFEVISYH